MTKDEKYLVSLEQTLNVCANELTDKELELLKLTSSIDVLKSEYNSLLIDIKDTLHRINFGE